MIFALATIIVVAAARGMKFGLIGIILFAAVDQGAYGFSYILRFPSRDIEAFLDSKAIPPEATRYRLQSTDNSLIMKGIRLSDGYASMQPRLRLDRLNEARLKLAGANWIWSKRPLFFDGTAYGARLAEPLPRARLLTQAKVSSDPGKDIDKIDIDTVALVYEEIELPGGKPGKAKITVDRPGAITVATESESRQLLVLSESYHDGWRAAVDGNEVVALAVYGDFMGCVVEAGTHEVKFVFKPKSLRNGALLSALGLLTALAVFIASAFMPRRERRTQS